mmetsp:Transcript_5163/g.9719  ORF Transcript_5163/g.9719 Transcript_5163/m.9719 type:complete len:84 (+) Transcript_5163:409-660(+)
MRRLYSSLLPPTTSNKALAFLCLEVDAKLAQALPLASYHGTASGSFTSSHNCVASARIGKNEYKYNFVTLYLHPRIRATKQHA